MSIRILIILLLFACTSHAQIITGRVSFDNLTIGGTQVTGISTDVNDSLAKDKLASMWVINQLMKANTTTIYTGIGILGTGTATDRLRVDVDLLKGGTFTLNTGEGILGVGSLSDRLRINMEKLFYQAKTSDIRGWRTVPGMLFWSIDERCFLYWNNYTLMKVYATQVYTASGPRPAPVRSVQKKSVLELKVDALQKQVDELRRHGIKVTDRMPFEIGTSKHSKK